MSGFLKSTSSFVRSQSELHVMQKTQENTYSIRFRAFFYGSARKENIDFGSALATVPSTVEEASRNAVPNFDGKKVDSKSDKAVFRAPIHKAERERERRKRTEARLQAMARSRFPRIHRGASHKEIKATFAAVVYSVGWRLDILMEANLIQNSKYVPMQRLETGRYNCTVKGCQETFSTERDSKKHAKSHFGKYMFCPACSERFSGDCDIEKHLDSLGGMCRKRLGQLWMLTSSEYINPKVKECCNMYALGSFNDFPMADEHFELVAGRERWEV